MEDIVDQFNRELKYSGFITDIFIYNSLVEPSIKRRIIIKEGIPEKYYIKYLIESLSYIFKHEINDELIDELLDILINMPDIDKILSNIDDVEVYILIAHKNPQLILKIIKDLTLRSLQLILPKIKDVITEDIKLEIENDILSKIESYSGYFIMAIYEILDLDINKLINALKNDTSYSSQALPKHITLNQV